LTISRQAAIKMLLRRTLNGHSVAATAMRAMVQAASSAVKREAIVGGKGRIKQGDRLLIRVVGKNVSNNRGQTIYKSALS